MSSNKYFVDVDFVSLVKLVLEYEKKQEEKFLSTEDIQELLSEEHAEPNARTSIFGYPTRPLYRELGTRLQQWKDEKKCPVLDLPIYDLLDEKTYTETRAMNIASITPKLESMQSLWSLWSEEEKTFRVRDILVILGKRGLLDLLGMRKTVGTFDLWPPPRNVTEATFNTKHNPTAELSVGARALAKHCHRDQSSSWWGASTGSEKAKNMYATHMMEKILNEAHWLNIHQLPHDVKVIEARQSQGYGVRWNADGESFRGFLEPQMVDGHEVGWRH